MTGKPHYIWWLAHIILGVISGLVVYILYKDRNPEAARFHLVMSLVIMIVVGVGVFFGIIAIELAFMDWT